ncbi:MAG: DUF1499 domain-containing protein [Deltaproteobacteria bacterium]|nr:DUF1499 domain-containing protein [Deltaproteobacteria bacterium]
MRIFGVVLQVVVFGVLIFVSLLVAGILSNRLPLTEPPGVVTRLATYLNTNVAETAEGAPFAELQLRRYEAPEGLLFDAARRAVQGLRWEISVLDDQKREIQAVVTTKMWKFQDDVTIQVRPGQPSGSVLWVRSASRVGKGDLGANTRHVLDLVEAVNGIVPVQALVPQKASSLSNDK